MKINLLIFGTPNFNKSLNEIKDHLDFSFVYFNNDHFSESILSDISAILVDSDVCSDTKMLNLINSINNKPLLLLEKQLFSKKCNYTDRICFPLIFSDFNNKITNLITSTKFN